MTQPSTANAGPTREKVWQMFDRISPRYDFLNRVLSMGIDTRWRKRMARHLPKEPAIAVLDLATGTADVLLFLESQTPRIAQGIGLDMSGGMLAYGREKLRRRGLAHKYRLVRGDATRLVFRDESFDAVTISFGIRNVLDVPAALREMRRILRPGGRAMVLEFSLPENAALRAGYLFYFRNILPRVGGMISGDANAYRYLNQTVESFPYGEDFCDLMREAGFEKVRAEPLSFGIATLYLGERAA